MLLTKLDMNLLNYPVPVEEFPAPTFMPSDKCLDVFPITIIKVVEKHTYLSLLLYTIGYLKIYKVWTEFFRTVRWNVKLLEPLETGLDSGVREKWHELFLAVELHNGDRTNYKEVDNYPWSISNIPSVSPTELSALIAYVVAQESLKALTGQRGGTWVS